MKEKRKESMGIVGGESFMPGLVGVKRKEHLPSQYRVGFVGGGMLRMNV